MKTVYVITHPEVVIDPKVPVPRWPLSEKGIARMRGLLHAPWIKNVTAVYSSEEQKAWEAQRDDVIKAIEACMRGEVEQAMNTYNRRK